MVTSRKQKAAVKKAEIQMKTPPRSGGYKALSYRMKDTGLDLESSLLPMNAPLSTLSYLEGSQKR